MHDRCRCVSFSLARPDAAPIVGLLGDHSSNGTVDLPPILTPAVDEAGVLKMVGGDRALLSEMIALFLEDYPKRVTEITDALRRNDAEAVEFAAHAVKGAAMTLCAPRVAKWALSIEKMGRAAELQSVGDALVALELELVQAHTGLSSIAGE